MTIRAKMSACLALSAITLSMTFVTTTSAQIRVRMVVDGLCGPPAHPETFLGPVCVTELVTRDGQPVVSTIAAAPQVSPVAVSAKPRGRFTSLGAGDPLGHQLKRRKEEQTTTAQK